MTDPFAVQPPTAEQPPAPLYGEPLPAPTRGGLGTAALILGCLSVLLGWLLVPPVLAVVFGLIGMRRARRGEASNRGLALTGVVLGALTLLFWGAVVALVVYVVQSPAYDRFQACDEKAITAQEHNSCAEELARTLFGD